MRLQVGALVESSHRNPRACASAAGAERDAALRGVSDEQLWGTRVHEGTAAPKKE